MKKGDDIFEDEYDEYEEYEEDVDAEAEEEELDTVAEAEEEKLDPEAEEELDAEIAEELDAEEDAIEKEAESQKNKEDVEAKLEEEEDSDKEEDSEEKLEEEEDLEEELAEDTTEDEAEDEDYEKPFVINDKKVKKKKKEKTIVSLLLVFGWLVLAVLIVIFCVFFLKKLPFMQEKKEKTTEEVVSTEYIYQVNENQEINTLIGDYYKAIVDCDLEAYKLTLTEPELVTDMVVYERKKELIYDYTNINVYTIPGLNQDEYIAYVTYNLQIAEVESTPIDIQSYYIVLQDGKLKIENRQFSDEITGYMNEKLGETDIQNLYKTAHDDTVRCLEEDPTFAEFYEKMNNPIQEEQE